MALLFNKLKQSSSIILFNKFVNLLSDHKNLALYLYALVLGLLVFVRMFDNSVWGDEGIVVVHSRVPFTQLIHYIASCGHSPLHYVVAWIFVKIFNESGFVYHLSASLPYFVVLLLSITAIKKWYGIKTALLFVTFCSLLKCAIIYNLEIRMYTWCILFCIICFLLTYQIYLTCKLKYYILLGVFSTLAAYTHYFALASIGVFYFFIFIKTIYENKISHFEEYVKFFISSILFLVLFIPWIIYVRGLKQGVISNYHNIGNVSWSSCFRFIFFSEPSFISNVLLYLWLLIPFVYYCKKVKLIRIDNSIESILTIRINYKNLLCRFNLSRRIYWIISGYIAVLSTITFSQLYSKFIFPITLHRYLYVSFIIAWLILAIELSSICKSKSKFVLLLISIIISLTPYYVKTASTEYKNNTLLVNTLAKTQPIITENDYIYTDIVHFAWTVCESYYPKIPHNLFGHKEWWGAVELPFLEESKNYYLFLSKPITNEIKDNLRRQNREYKTIVENGYIGTGAVWIYMIPK